MIHHREKNEVRRFDIFKLIVLLILIALLLWFWLSPPQFVQGPVEQVAATAVATQPATGNAPDEATAEPARQIDAPELISPLLSGGLEAGSFTLSGSGTAGSTVRIVLDGAEVGTTEVAADGRWSFDLALTEGSRALSLEALDADGGLVHAVDLPAFTVAAPAPSLAIPTLELPEGDLAGGPLHLSGTGTPGSEVGLLVDGDLVGTAVVAPDGTWTFPATLDAGEHELSLRLLAPDGSLLAETEAQVVTVAAAAEAEAEEPAAEFALPAFDLPADEQIGGEVTLSGSGTPGSELEIVVDGAVVGTAVVADNGTWQFPTTLPAGTFELTLRTVDGTGTVVETEPVSFSLAAAEEESASEAAEDAAAGSAASLPADFCKNAEPGIDQGETYIVGVCEWLVKIANRLGIPYPDLIGANPQIENPNLIYPGQAINLPPR